MVDSIRLESRKNIIRVNGILYGQLFWNITWEKDETEMSLVRRLATVDIGSDSHMLP